MWISIRTIYNYINPVFFLVKLIFLLLFLPLNECNVQSIQSKSATLVYVLSLIPEYRLQMTLTHSNQFVSSSGKSKQSTSPLPDGDCCVLSHFPSPLLTAICLSFGFVTRALRPWGMCDMKQRWGATFGGRFTNS